MNIGIVGNGLVGSTAAYAIIMRGIGSAIAKIVDVILHDQRSILTVSTATSLVGGVPGVSISLPNIVGGNGVIGTLSLPLNSGEDEELKRSAEILKAEIEKINLN